jgi:hypothetical protein
MKDDPSTGGRKLRTRTGDGGARRMGDTPVSGVMQVFFAVDYKQLCDRQDHHQHEEAVHPHLGPLVGNQTRGEVCAGSAAEREGQADCPVYFAALAEAEAPISG